MKFFTIYGHDLTHRPLEHDTTIAILRKAIVLGRKPTLASDQMLSDIALARRQNFRDPFQTRAVRCILLAHELISGAPLLSRTHFPPPVLVSERLSHEIGQVLILTFENGSTPGTSTAFGEGFCGGAQWFA